ncbi:MAG: GTP-binding protein [Clostridia bacterium]
MKTRIILVGGFLGAGKTTLLVEMARILHKQGKRIGLITNDQAAELVDTELLEKTNGFVSEVSGSCFCCNFNGFTDAIVHLKAEKQVDIIIAEPVGSCTDLSATIVQPLKQKFDDLLLAPLSVLIDPQRLVSLLDGTTTELHSSAVYIIRKQLEEADIIVLSKIDLFPQDFIEKLMKRAMLEWPKAKIFLISAKNGEGLQGWLAEVTNSLNAGTHLADIDYEIYAEGEAVLGWLNISVKLESESANWDDFISKLLNALSQRFDNSYAAVAHVKLFIEEEGEYLVGNLTGKKDTISIRGSIGVGEKARMTLNARVQMDPDILKSIIEEEVSEVCGSDINSSIIEFNCLKPGIPKPTHRYDYVVKNY